MSIRIEEIRERLDAARRASVPYLGRHDGGIQPWAVWYERDVRHLLAIIETIAEDRK